MSNENKGIIRKIDPLGRLVIPKEIRDHLGIDTDNPVEIKLIGDQIHVSKYEEACLICGNTSYLINFEGKNICKNCIDDIKDI